MFWGFFSKKQGVNELYEKFINNKIKYLISLCSFGFSQENKLLKAHIVLGLIKRKTFEGWSGVYIEW